MYHKCMHCMIKLIKITIKYIKWAYTTDKHNVIIGIPLLQEWWRWHCFSHPDYLCLNVDQVTFYYSPLEVHISKTKNDWNKWISDSESRHLDDYTWLSGRSIFRSNILTYMRKEMCRSTLLFTLILPYLDLYTDLITLRFIYTFDNLKYAYVILLIFFQLIQCNSFKFQVLLRRLWSYCWHWHFPDCWTCCWGHSTE